MCLTDSFFALLRFSLGITGRFGYTLDDSRWNALYEMAKSQALLGVMFKGVERLPKEQAPGRTLLLKWYSASVRVEHQNRLLYAEVASVCSALRREGMRACVLKGQGNAMAYPDMYSRTPGDIDVWAEGDRRQIAAVAAKVMEVGGMHYYHIEGKTGKGVDVEIHFMPSIMNNRIYNRRLQQWFRANSGVQFSHTVDLPEGVGSCSIPTAEFNVVYQLSHIFHHFFDEGVGLRQITDYYYVLCRFSGNRQTVASTLRHLGLYRFAGALMWLMHIVFDMPQCLMIVPEDAKRGQLLYQEVMEGGNFGRSFSRYGSFTRQGMCRKYFLKIYRNMHFVRYYPAEALAEPLFRTWHFFWRKWNFCGKDMGISQK